MPDTDCDYIRCYWLDNCSVCGSECITACRCPLNDRDCVNGHHWRRLDDGSAIQLTAGHGREIARFPAPDL